MKILFAVVTFLGLFTSLSAQHVFPAKFKNVKTKEHVRIAGTPIFVIPPEGFKTSLSSLKKNDSAAIYFVLTHKSVTHQVENYTTSLLAKTDAIIDSGVSSLGSLKVTFIVTHNQVSHLNGYALFVGDTADATVIVAKADQSDSNSCHGIIASMQSIYIDKKAKYDPLEAYLFTVDDSHSSYKLYDMDAGSLNYSLGGTSINPEDDTSSYIRIINEYFPEKLSAKEVAGKLANILNGEKDYKLYDSRDIPGQGINGFETDETILYGMKKLKPIEIYQAVLVHEQKVIWFIGYIKKDFTNQLNEMRKLAATLKFK